MAAVIRACQDAYAHHHMERTHVTAVRSLSDMEQDLVMSTDQR
jgi:hypothetical protein